MRWSRFCLVLLVVLVLPGLILEIPNIKNEFYSTEFYFFISSGVLYILAFFVYRKIEKGEDEDEKKNSIEEVTD